VDVRLQAGLGPSDNRVTSLTTQRGMAINTNILFHKGQFLLGGTETIILKFVGFEGAVTLRVRVCMCSIVSQFGLITQSPL
jgi:hypothetical protein